MHSACASTQCTTCVIALHEHSVQRTSRCNTASYSSASATVAGNQQHHGSGGATRPVYLQVQVDGNRAIRIWCSHLSTIYIRPVAS